MAAACRDLTIDLVFIIDGSGSICDPPPRDDTGGCPNWNFVTNFVAEFVRILEISKDGNHVAIVTFNDNARTAVYLNEYVT